MEPGKENLIFSLSKCFDTEQGVTRTPLNRIPFGLLDYNIRFFVSDYAHNIGCEQHYVELQTSMFAHFGNKWVCLNRGPAWQYEGVSGDECSEQNTKGLEWGTEVRLSCVESYAADKMTDEVQGQETGKFDSLLSSDILETALKGSGIELEVNEDYSESLHVPTTVSQLWSSVKEADAKEIQLGQATPEEMEKYHKIEPTSRTRKRNPYIGVTKKAKKMYECMLLGDAWATNSQ